MKDGCTYALVISVECRMNQQTRTVQSGNVITTPYKALRIDFHWNPVCELVVLL